jgi:hypothetical protein
MLAIEREWRRGRAATLAGFGVLIAGGVSYWITGSHIFDQNGPWWPFSLWPFAVMWLGAIIMGFGQMYLFGMECPACRAALGNHLAMGGVWGKSLPIRFCPRCGAEILTDQSLS